MNLFFKKKFIVFSFILFTITASFFIFPSKSNAWNDDMHYYLTYYLARNVGFDDMTSRKIAGTDAYTDYHKLTLATAFPPTHYGNEMRRLWHFPELASDMTGPNTERKNLYSTVNLYSGLQYCDIFLFSIALHCYQDSWSHETWGIVKGHLLKGHWPDFTFEHLAAAQETSVYTYEMLKILYKRTTGTDSKQANLTETMKKFLDEMFKFKPMPECDTSWGAVKCYWWDDDFDKAVTSIGNNWMKNWTYGTDPKLDLRDYETKYKDDFEARLPFYSMPIDNQNKLILDFNKLGKDCLPLPIRSVTTPQIKIPTIDEDTSILSMKSQDELVNYMVNNGETYRLRNDDVAKFLSNEQGIKEIMDWAKEQPIATVSMLSYLRVTPHEEFKKYMLPYMDYPDTNTRIVAAFFLSSAFNDEKAKSLLNKEFNSASDSEKKNPYSAVANFAAPINAIK